MTQLLNAIPGALAQGLIWGVMAIGVYITYKVLDIADLTVDGSLCTGAAVCTMLLLAGHSPWIAMLCAVLAGLLAGTVTGLLHVLLGIPPILAGILTQMVLWSVNLKILGKANQALPARSIDVLLTQMNIPAALPVLLGWAAVLVTLLVLFFSTELGCALRATGCNPVMSRAQGVNTGLMKVIGLALSNAVVAMSGGLLCQYQGYTDVNMGRGAVVIGLAAVVIGQAVLGRHGGHMAAQLGGVVLGGEERMDALRGGQRASWGACMDPFAAWLLIRSLRTLEVRMARHSASADKVARFLQEHPRVRSVCYPGLETDEGHTLAQTQMTGYSGLMSFVPDADNEAIHAMVKSLDVFEEGPSWGGFESVVNTPGLNPNREMLQFEGIPQGLVRISVGLEDADTLIEDLDRALNTLPR